MAIASLMYHDVVAPGADDESGFPGPSAASYKFTWSDYEAQVERLAATGLRFPRVDSADAAAPDCCLLTFDDGGASALASARVLERHGMVGHFLITGAMVDRPGFVTAADVRSLAAAGHVVGSHSHTHPPDISRLPAEQLAAEWRDSVARLADIVDAPVTVASIPGGFYSRAVADAALAAGVRHLFTSEPTTRTTRRGDAVLLGRYALQRGMSAELVEAFACGSGLARQRQWLLWNLKKPAKRWAAPLYRWLRRRSFGGA